MERRVLIAIAIVSVVFALIAKNAYDRERDRGSNLLDVIHEREARIDSVKLKNNLVMYEKVRVEMERDDLLESYSEVRDSLKVMGIKNKDLQSALLVSRETTGSGEGVIDTVTVTMNDTTYVASHINIDEKYFKFTANILSSSRFDYNYSIYDNLTVVNSTSRKNIFSPRVHKVSVLNENPKTVLTGITSVTIKESPPKWVIGPAAGFGLTSTGAGWFIGVAIVRPIVRF